MSFKIASKFRAAAAEINKVPVEKFPLLLNRLVQRLHIRNAELFSAEEETQLKTLFSLSSEQLKLILDGCCYIFEQVYLIICDIGIASDIETIIGSIYIHWTRASLRALIGEWI